MIGTKTVPLNVAISLSNISGLTQKENQSKPQCLISFAT